jgi:hypothetical protein
MYGPRAAWLDCYFHLHIAASSVLLLAGLAVEARRWVRMDEEDAKRGR